MPGLGKDHTIICSLAFEINSNGISLHMRGNKTANCISFNETSEQHYFNTFGNEPFNFMAQPAPLGLKIFLESMASIQWDHSKAQNRNHNLKHVVRNYGKYKTPFGKTQ
ncbi:unnamed protein product [Ixodes persulcatus]